MEHVRWLSQPTLRNPIVIAAFTGWNDAGDAASTGVRHLIEDLGAAALAEIDPEEFTDFATIRPHVRLSAGLSRNIVWPTVGMWHASTPGADVILVLGPEGFGPEQLLEKMQHDPAVRRIANLLGAKVTKATRLS